MKKPANPAGVVFSAVMAVVLLVLVLLLGPENTTRKGVPVWLLGAVGIPSFLSVAVHCWRRPRRSRSR